MRCLLVVLATAFSVQAAPLTPKALIEAERPGDCQLSPDGRWLALTVGRADWSKNRIATELQVFRVGDRQPMWRMKGGAQLRWAPDSHQFLFQQDGNWSLSSNENWRIRRLAQWTEAQNPVWSPDSRQLAFVRAAGPKPVGDSGRLYDDLFVRRWNRYHDGRRLHLWVSDTVGNVRDATPKIEGDAAPTSGSYSSGTGLCFSADGSALFSSVPPVRGQAVDTNYDVWRFPLDGSTPENLSADNPAADMGPRLDVQQQRLYIVSHQRPGYESDFSRLRSVAVDPGGRPTGPWREELLGEGDGLSEVFVHDGQVLYTRNIKARTQAFIRDNSGKVRSLGAVHGLSWHGKQWAGVRDSMSVPPHVVMGDLNGNPQLAITKPANWDLGKVENLEVPVEDATMQMWLVKPPNYDPGRRWPLVMLIHGGPQGGWSDGWSLRWNPQVWAAQGYLVVMPNPRGSSGQGQAFQEQVSRDWGGRAYRDLMKGLDSLLARPDVDSDRVVAAGASYGGYMVNWLAVHSQRFRALVTHCGVWNLESMYGTTDELWFTDWELGGPPWTAEKRPPDYDQFSPHKFAEKLGVYKTPHLVVHNDLDYRCPIDQGLQLYTALQRQNVPSRFLNFPDEGHWVLKPANSLRWHLEVFAFLQHHNQAR